MSLRAKERVLVTGGGGYIGTALVPALLDEGYAVRVVDRCFFGHDLLPDHDALDLVQEDSRRMAPEVVQDVDHVIDLVALSNDPTGELFEKATWEINCESRVRTAGMAKQAGAKRYVLPSSCSIYGFQDKDVIVDETSPTNPLTTYARANEKAERGVLALADEDFCVTVLRQATVYGYSPRMRFDLAINGMTYGAWKTGKLPLMRDGTQWRPMLHVKDAAAAMCFMLQADRDAVNGEIVNVGSDVNNYQLKPLAETVARVLPNDVEIEWYGDPDHRSYRVSFAKLLGLGFHARYQAEDGAREVYEALAGGKIDKTPKTITLEWYKQLAHWHEVIKSVEMYGGIVEI
jgi:nucleoside-diphosphate-sugar epimerase